MVKIELKVPEDQFEDFETWLGKNVPTAKADVVSFASEPGALAVHYAVTVTIRTETQAEMVIRKWKKD